MKLKHILEDLQPRQIKTQIAGRRFDVNKRLSANIDVVDLLVTPAELLNVSRDALGAGIQGLAWDHGPGTVVKQAFVNGLNDSYLKFINISMDHQTNPFFPRIYKATLYDISTTAGDKALLLVVLMEKLYKITHPKLQDSIIRAYYQAGFKTTDYDKRSIAAIANKDPSIERKILHNQLRFILRGQTLPKFNYDLNPQFMEALKILTPHISHFGDDLHTHNIMVRLTSVGPQLVIVDPFTPTANF